MKSKIDKEVTVVVILYKTPNKRIYNLKQYKDFKLIILDQGSLHNSKKKIRNILGFKFTYYHSKKNLGLSKGMNFLIKKTKTKYCMITEPDILINKESILNLKKNIQSNKNFLITSPCFNKNKKLKKFKILEKIDLSCVLFEKKKMLNFNFYDEDYFFFWTDIDFIRRVNMSNFKMIESRNAYANHLISKSSNMTMYLKFLRDKSYKYGELVFDYKYNKLRFLKVIRQLIQSLARTFFYLILFNKNKFCRNIGYFIGLINFLIFLSKKKIL